MINKMEGCLNISSCLSKLATFDNHTS